MTKRAVKLAQYVLVVVVFYYAAHLVWVERAALLRYFADAGASFHASVVLLAVFFYLQALIWTWLLNTPDRQVAAFRGSVIYVNAQVAKYVPGAIWNAAFRMLLAGRHGATLAAQLKSMYYESVLLVWVAAAYGLVLLAKLHAIGWYGLLLAGAATGLFYAYYEPVGTVAERWMKRRTRRFADVRLLHPRRSFFAYLACYLGSHLLMGVAFWLLLRSFGVRHIDVVEATGTYTLAWLLGLISPLPGGLGLREGALVYMLSLQAVTDTAHQIAVVARAWSLLAELLLLGIMNAADYLGKKVNRSWR